MTSDEIKNYEIAGTERNDPRLSAFDSATDVERNMMLKEIAYQLAVMNERNAELINKPSKQERSYAVSGPDAYRNEGQI